MYMQWQRTSIVEMQWTNKSIENTSDNVAKCQEQTATVLLWAANYARHIMTEESL
jgi:hypothetical protein